MRYNNVVFGEFIERPNRFIAKVKIKNQTHTVHVKNTGRCKELLLKGARIVLEESHNSERKTKYDLIAVEKQGLGLVNIDSSAPNKAVLEWLQKQDYDYIKPEHTFGNSRFDFYMEKNGEKYLMEVKGCTLEIGGIGYFPDAPTIRGLKHINELIKAKKQGYKSIIAFVIQMQGITEVRGNQTTHPEFADALEEARKSGVEILFLTCKVTPDSMQIVGDN